MGMLRIKHIMYAPGCPRPTFQTACRATTPLLLPSLPPSAEALCARSSKRDVFNSGKAEAGVSIKPTGGRWSAREALNEKPDAPATRTATVHFTACPCSTCTAPRVLLCSASVNCRMPAPGTGMTSGSTALTPPPSTNVATNSRTRTVTQRMGESAPADLATKHAQKLMLL